jgi:glycosyltransferase involved in cell wall biosynthesis
MKIAFILPVNGITGGVHVVCHHADSLSRLGHDVTILFVSDSMGMDVTFIGDFRPKRIRLDDAVNSGTAYDVVIATWWETYYDMFQISASRYMYFCQSDERRFYPSRMSYEIPFVEHTYLNRGVGVITMARWIVDWLQREYETRAEYVPNGIDLSIFNPDVRPLAPKGERVRVLIEGAGGVFFKRVANAFRITGRIPDIEVWYVCGDGYVRPEWKFNRMFSRLSLEEMPPIYASCDILIKLSSVESFSYPPLEMMACGGTAVAAKFTGHEEYIRHEENALLVEIDDEEEAHRALKRLVDDAELRKRLSEGGVRTAQEWQWRPGDTAFANHLENFLKNGKRVSASDLNSIKIVNELRKCRKYQEEVLPSRGSSSGRLRDLLRAGKRVVKKIGGIRQNRP